MRGVPRPVAFVSKCKRHLGGVTGGREVNDEPWCEDYLISSE